MTNTTTNLLTDWQQITACNGRVSLFIVALSLFFGFAPMTLGQPLAPLTNPATALQEYVRTPDEHYRFKVADVDRKLLFTQYTIRMQSQAWNPGGMVLNRAIWEHGIALLVPRLITTDTGLLFIAGGSNDENLISDDEVRSAQRVALLTGSVVAVLFEVPNQPLQFSDEPFEHTEDELVAYSWDKAMDTADYSWPVYLPMVKSTVRAMDTVQAILPRIRQFVVTGFSKRGAATWLTAAVDPRVKAIAPGVFDILNFAPQAKHQVKVYGCFAPALKDYYDYRIFQRIDTPEGIALGLVADPYSYIRRPGFRNRLSLPKYLINSSGDQFFLPDAARFYWSRLPVEKRIRYVPDSDHSLSNTATVFANTLTGLLGWYRAVLSNNPRPPISWFLNESRTLVVKTSSPDATARLWRATNATARDFRLTSIGEAWTSSVLRSTSSGIYEARVPPPRSGWTAYFVEVTHPSAIPQIYSTQIFVTPDQPRPFEGVNVTQATLCPQ
jgi:PhoPQ-activated pathogenicity-related protein